MRGTIVGVCAAGFLGVPAPADAASGTDDDWATGSVRIERVEVEPVARLEPGAQLVFTVYGSPGATATLRIDGARAPLALREVYGGVYEGRYVVRPDEHIAPQARATAALRRGGDVATAQLEEPLVEGVELATVEPQVPPVRAGRPVPPAQRIDTPVPARTGRPVPAAAGTGFAAACADCAVVEAVDAVEPRRPGVAGAVIGGLLGALVADQAATGPNRHVARLLGALGGAFAGHAIASRSADPSHYDVRLRLPDGRTQVRRYEGAPPPWRPGDVIRLDARSPLARGSAAAEAARGAPGGAADDSAAAEAGF